MSAADDHRTFPSVISINSQDEKEMNIISRKINVKVPENLNWPSK